MRQLCQFEEAPTAQRFAAALLGRGIDVRVDGQNEQWEIWIRDEDQLPVAAELLAEFRANPQAPQFNSSAKVTLDQLQPGKPAPTPRSGRTKVIRMRDRWDSPFIARPGIVCWFLGVMCVLVFVMDPGNRGSRNDLDTFAAHELFVSRLVYQPLPSFLDETQMRKQMGELLAEAKRIESGENVDLLKKEQEQRELAAKALFGMERQPLFASIRQGEVWRIWTPIFLHFGIAHIAFNIMALFSYGSLLETAKGSLRLLLLTVALGAISNTSEYLWGYWWNPLVPVIFGGMSGVLCGWFGYAWMQSRYNPGGNVYLDPGRVIYMLLFLALCVVGVFGPIANAAHLGGLLAGIGIAWGEIWLERRAGS
ncbi:MAG: rhomboid family intramembrane serine protease [Pirellulales bacterium]|nr:rhomboid family intramembrane serine protease [Pirellulales bacterium]